VFLGILNDGQSPKKPVISSQFSVRLENHGFIILVLRLRIILRAIILNDVVEFDFSPELGYSNSGAIIKF
jgi:hypothetical protein